MVKGLKQTSQTVSIGFSVNEPAPNTFTEGSVDLNLSPLDREVFVVTAINLDPIEPDAIAATNTDTLAALTTTSQAASAPAMPNLSNPNCLATAKLSIRAAGFVDGGVGFTRLVETPAATSQLDYIGIIATNDFFIQVRGGNNVAAKSVSGKLYGYRAVADASIYSALVQSEVLSA
jgi:hypothetical protein